MRSFRRVRIWPLVFFLDCTVRKRLAASMLAIPDCVRRAVDEADHVMFPILPLNLNYFNQVNSSYLPVSDVVTKFQA